MLTKTNLVTVFVLVACALWTVFASTDDSLYSRGMSWQTAFPVHLSTTIRRVMQISSDNNLNTEIIISSTSPVDITITNCTDDVLLRSDEPIKKAHIVIPQNFINEILRHKDNCTLVFLTGSTHVFAESNYTMRVRNQMREDGFLPGYTPCPEENGEISVPFFCNAKTISAASVVLDKSSGSSFSMTVYHGLGFLAVFSVFGALLSGPCLVSDGLRDDDDEATGEEEETV